MNWMMCIPLVFYFAYIFFIDSDKIDDDHENSYAFMIYFDGLWVLVGVIIGLFFGIHNVTNGFALKIFGYNVFFHWFRLCAVVCYMTCRVPLKPIGSINNASISRKDGVMYYMIYLFLYCYVLLLESIIFNVYKSFPAQSVFDTAIIWYSKCSCVAGLMFLVPLSFYLASVAFMDKNRIDDQSGFWPAILFDAFWILVGVLICVFCGIPYGTNRSEFYKFLVHLFMHVARLCVTFLYTACVPRLKPISTTDKNK